jgi:hypothetical protein
LRAKTESLQVSLNLEHPSGDARPARVARLDILSILGRNDVLTRFGMVHDGFLVREELVERDVEDAGGNEGVDVTNVEAGGRISMTS